MPTNNPVTEREVKLKINTLRLEISDPAIPERERKAKRAELSAMYQVLKWIKESFVK